MARGLTRFGWLGVAAVAASLGLGCALDERDVQLSTPDGGQATVVGNLDPAAGGIGAACQQNTECGTGNCVDGVCCDSPCTELCATCNAPGSLGVCSTAPRDPLCPEVSCPGQSSECRPLDGGQAGINCEAVGVCRASAECQALPADVGTPCQQGTGTCDGTGACLVPNKSPLGAACEADDNCAEGHCVASGPDGARVCCDAACDGACQACSAAGRCEGTPTTDARCEAVICPADNVCRDYADAITENLCRSFGQCKGAIDCVSADAFTSLRPSAQCVCDPASGGCALAAGTTCQQGTDCASAACVQTTQGNLLCCSEACAPGLFCSSTGTGCIQCEGSDVTCDGNVERTCQAGSVATTSCTNGCTPGTGCNDLPPVGFLCDAGQCAPGGVCQADTGGQSRCCVRNCAAEGKVCSPTGSCDCPPGQVATGNSCLLQPGDPCQSTAQCQAGLSCVDGVCCGEACGGFCERCQAGTGLCVAVAAGQQEVDAASGNDCNNGFECTGTRNTCRARTGQACSSTDGSDCVSGNCETTVGGGARICCSQDCGGVTGSCRSTGLGCVQCESAAQCGNGCNVAQGICNPLSPPGSTCSVASQCSTNGCVPAADGGNLRRCCANCGAGQLCNAQGQCINAQSELGGSCNGNADCRVGVCSTGRCCSAACDTACETCGTSGACQSNGQCDAFDCIVPDPPVVASNLPAGNNVFLLTGATPPTGRGGTIADGRYVPVRIDFYGDAAAGFVETYEFRGRSVQIAEQDFFMFAPPSSFLPERHYTGNYRTNGTSLSFDIELCEVQFDIDLSATTVQYTATANGLVTIAQQANGVVVINFARQ